jgi:FkbM family methyltransferase
MFARFLNTSGFILDLGMNNGDDVEYYLKKEFRVLAIEANPALCQLALNRFENAVKTGRLTILNAAISRECGTVQFYVNLENDHWSSMDPEWAGRDGTTYKEILVQSISITHIFLTYGIPFYMKVDVEGADDLVIAQLIKQKQLPYYLSVEDCRFGYKYLETLSAIGYKDFKLLDQSKVPQLLDESTGHCFKKGSSGPFGEDVPGGWLPIDKIEEQYAREVRDRNLVRQASRDHWWDIHCRGVA